MQNTEKHPELSIIIINHNSDRYLEDCLYSIRENLDVLSYETIVVNNSPLPTPLNTQFDWVRQINTENSGFGAANNIGASFSKGDYLLFLNPDTKLVTKNFSILLSGMKKNPSIAITAPCLLNDEKSIQPWSTGFSVTFSDIILNNIGLIRSKEAWLSKKPIDVAWVSGAALCIKRNVFEQLKGFDIRFFMYFEDVDLCKRACDNGHTIRMYPQVKVLHLGGKSSPGKKLQKESYYKSQDYYFQKHFHPIKGFFIRLLRRIFI